MPNGFLRYRNNLYQTCVALKNITRSAFYKLYLIPCFLAFWSVVSNAAQPQSDVTELSLEELMNAKVTSVAKKLQRVSESAAAVHVITSDDIRRSGATSIPELLRNVPGLHVARIDSNKWAISARGFNGRFSNKLLVLMDGRSLYTPVFSGVFWNLQDTFLPDIERIEIIRGPGGTVWGANAVNGVINIITKSADKTNGTLAKGIVGSEERENFSFRYGQAIDETSNFRAFVKHTRRDGGLQASGQDGSDDSDVQRGGFRYDNKNRSGDHLMLQGEAYIGNMGQQVSFPALTAPFANTFSDDIGVDGQFILGRWSTPTVEGSQFSLQSYVERKGRREAHGNLLQYTFDIETQKRQRLAGIHDLVFGMGYRYGRDTFGASADVAINPSHDTYHLFSAFVQDEISITEDIKVTLGSKVEHNSFTGFEVQPSIRGLWQATPTNTFWSAVSRAVRTPSRGEDGAILNAAVTPAALPVLARNIGSTDLKSEELVALELGYKTQPTRNLSLDIAAFYNIYDNLQTTEPGALFLEASPGPLHLVLPLTLANNMKGEAFGAEIGADWRPTDRLRLRATYTYIDLKFHLDPGAGVAANEAAEDREPHHQASLTAQLDITDNIEFDATVRAVDSLSERQVSGYATLDLRLGWRPIENVEISIVGQNLAQSHHLEFVPEALATQPSEIGRAVFGSLKIKF